MLEKFIKQDRNEQLERVLEEKNIDEQVRNLLQGILYKVEVSYKDFQKAKVTEVTEKQYVQEIIENIQKKCNQINTVKFSDQIENEKQKKKLEQKKFYIDEKQIISYPIEEKLLYAIERKSNNSKIVNNRYGIITNPLSNIINIGKSLDRVEVLRDFNGFSWTTIKTEVENIKANLFYQTLQILLGEEFINSWTKDVDGIIDYVQLLKEEISDKYGEEISNQIEQRITQISIMNEAEENQEYRAEIEKKLAEISEIMQNYNDTQKYVQQITINKRKATEEIKEIEKILSQEARIKEEYKNRNEGVPLEKKIFSIRVLKQQLNEQKQQLLKDIEYSNYLLNPANYLEEKNKIQKEKELLEVINYNIEEKENVIIEFLKLFLQCFNKMIEKVEQENIVKTIYKFRYFMLLPFNLEKSIKNVEQLRNEIMDIEEKLIKIAKDKKVIAVEVPLEVMRHVFETRIIILEELYYKIETDKDKKYVQIFDENITEEKFEIETTEKVKINKKIKIFI